MVRRRVRLRLDRTRLDEELRAMVDDDDDDDKNVTPINQYVEQMARWMGAFTGADDEGIDRLIDELNQRWYQMDPEQQAEARRRVALLNAERGSST